MLSKWLEDIPRLASANRRTCRLGPVPSDAAAYITGQAINVDGVGYVLKNQ
jgi:hypothetical protein